MATKRQTKKVNVGITAVQAEEAFAVFAKADARQAQITAEMDAKFTKIRQQHQEELSELTTAKEEQFAVMEAFAMENREEHFSKRKSMDMVHGTLGFRTSNPSLKTLRGFTWASVTELLKEFLPDYIRTKIEPDKEALLADRDSEQIASQFKRCGIVVNQGETFFVEPKKEEV